MKKENSRRDFIKKSAFATAAVYMGGGLLNSVIAEESANGNLIEPGLLETTGTAGTYTLPELPYEQGALEPHIDKLTMQIHHTKHHNAYVTNLNKAIETLDEKLLERSVKLETIFEKMSKFPDAIRNNAGGHFNHSMFWNCMKPAGGGAPKGALADAINASFGSFEEFKTKFNEAATKRFGSGWAWLIVVEDKLVITSTANQDNPLMKLKDKNHVMGRPILALDVWEHAYYLKNQNRRADYLTAFWNVVNWEYCEGVFG